MDAAEIEKKLVMVSKDLSAVKGSIAGLYKRFDERASFIDKLSKDYSRLKESFRYLTNEYEDHKVKVGSVVAQQVELADSIRTMSVDVADLKTGMSFSNGLLEDLKGRLDRLEGVKKDLLKDNSELGFKMPGKIEKKLVFFFVSPEKKTIFRKFKKFTKKE